MTDDMVYLVDPTAEMDHPDRQRVPRPAALDGLTIGLIDNTRPRSAAFLDRLGVLLAGHGLAVRRYRKHHFSAPAETALKHTLGAECSLAVEAIAD